MPSSLTISEFYRSIQQNISTPHTILLGAGASIESGIQSAADCIWEWKRNIFTICIGIQRALLSLALPFPI